MHILEELLTQRAELANKVRPGRYSLSSNSKNRSALDSRMDYLALLQIDSALRACCSSPDSVWDKTPCLCAYNLQQMFANNAYNSQQISTEAYEHVRDVIYTCQNLTSSLQSVASMRMSPLCTHLPSHTRTATTGLWPRHGSCSRRRLFSEARSGTCRGWVRALCRLRHAGVRSSTTRTIDIVTYKEKKYFVC